MTIDEVRKRRERNKISVLDLAARTGLPAEYIEKLESKEAIALESDLARLQRALLQAEKEKSDPDYEPPPVDKGRLEDEEI